MADVSLTLDEQAVMDHVAAAYAGLLRLNGRQLAANHGELTQAVHTIQGFVIQSACGRLGLFGCNDWWTDVDAETATRAPESDERRPRCEAPGCTVRAGWRATGTDDGHPYMCFEHAENLRRLGGASFVPLLPPAWALGLSLETRRRAA